MFEGARGVVIAVALAGLSCHAYCRAQSVAGQAVWREFRDQRGRAIQARVLKVSGEPCLQKEDAVLDQKSPNN